MKKTRYALAGASGRGWGMYAKPLAGEYSGAAEIVGIYDVNHKRSEIVKRDVNGEFPVCRDFDEMLEAGRPDVVIITTVDRFHHEYAIRAMEFGCDVIVEKPMTIDAEKCNEMMACEKRTGKTITVTFNYRYTPFATRVKQLVHEGLIGEVFSVHFEWMLDTRHGADYFRRWHRLKENSGGLLVHKATHHFDFANWAIDDEPEAVSAFGTRRFYGLTREKRGERCMNCRYKKECEFYFNLDEGSMSEFYLGAEDIDGYIRDRCVFDPAINIEDSMNVLVKYVKGAAMSYSLTAHSPYEGYKLVINGSGGRIEADNYHGSVGPFTDTDEPTRLRLYNRLGEEVKMKQPRAEGDHGGGDKRLLEDLFGVKGPDPLGRRAGSRAGAMSAGIGICANLSMASGNTVRVGDILKF